MELGAFSISLAVKDIEASRRFAGDAAPTRLLQEADERTTGPASFVAVDPDGNSILVDQHV